MLKHENVESGKRRFGVAAAFVISVMVLAAKVSPSLALEKVTVLDGMSKCITWCEKHNPPGNSRNACQNKCRKYWYCNGKDAANYTLNCKHYSGLTAQITTNPQTGTGTGTRSMSPINSKPTATINKR